MVVESRTREERIVGELRDTASKNVFSDSVHFLLERTDSPLDQLDVFEFGGIETGFVSVQMVQDSVKVSRHGQGILSGGFGCQNQK